ncbi:MAG TPA: YncE family protein [Caulobacteraceae bacterium]|nr:YncE family protein [Caulobacteraceae bacterium]
MRSRAFGGLRLTSVAALATLLLGSAAVAASPAPLYRLAATIPLGVPDRWDYVVFDPGSKRVFVAHGDRVDVADPATAKLVGAIRGIPGGTHGIAIAARAGRGYTDDGKAGRAISFDLRSLAVTKSLPADTDADAIAFDPASGHVFVVSGDPGVVTVIDPVANVVAASVHVGEKLEYVVSGGDGKVYVSGNGDGDLVRIDAETNAVDAHWPLAGCDKPKGLAYDRRFQRLFVSCVNDSLVVVNANTGSEVAKLAIGRGTDAAAFDPVRRRVFSSNRDGTLTVISQEGPDRYSVLGTVATQPSGRTMAVDPATGRLYIAAAVVNPATGLVPGSLKLLIYKPSR